MIENKDVMIAIVGAGATVVGFGLVFFGIIVSIANDDRPPDQSLQSRAKLAPPRGQWMGQAVMLYLLPLTLLPSVLAGGSVVLSLRWLTLYVGHDGAQDGNYGIALWSFWLSLGALAYDALVLANVLRIRGMRRL